MGKQTKSVAVKTRPKTNGSEQISLPVDVFPPHRQRFIADLREARPDLGERGAGAARLLHEWRASTELQLAAYLLPFVENDLLNLTEVAPHCGERVAFLCSEYFRIMRLPADSQWAGDPLRRRYSVRARECVEGAGKHEQRPDGAGV